MTAFHKLAKNAKVAPEKRRGKLWDMRKLSEPSIVQVEVEIRGQKAEGGENYLSGHFLNVMTDDWKPKRVSVSGKND